MSSVLIIEDNLNIVLEVSEYFKKNGFDAKCPASFQYSDIIAEKADVILLDINLDGEDGLDICRKIRESSNVPILFVTGREREEDELRALSLGGDDYIRKPYRLPVLLAKVNRILERYRIYQSDCSNDANRIQSDELAIGNHILNIVKSQLTLGQETIDLSKNEMKILYYLFLNKDRIISKDELIEYLWENKLYVDENILNVNLSRLRKRLAGIGYKDYITTVPKAGYQINIKQNGSNGDIYELD
jgi:DNA-binding response OmpR family regulator